MTKHIFDIEKKKLIKDYAYLLWWVKESDKEKINEEALVELILNDGDWKGVQRLLALLGIKKVREIFFKQTSGLRCNYRKQTKHFFTLYFENHVS
ncbi:MAG: hypothetical protein Q8N83_13275 [Ignavibacteria bacterium]|nr:hypothetical protein [Ignavibacteria bacterium]